MAKAKMKKWSDTEFEEEIITKVTDEEDYYSIVTENNWCSGVEKKYNIRPIVGTKVRFYGKGLGSPIRGLMLDGKMVFYRTQQEQAEKDEQSTIDYYIDQRQEFEKNKTELDAKYNALPDIFKKRIDKFRRNNPDFRWKYESYEMFVCTEAVKIAEALKTVDAIKSWSGVGNLFNMLPYKEPRKQVLISDDHSGNTLNMATLLACLYIENPEGVQRLHGALAPLVGSAEYGCIPKTEAVSDLPEAK